MGKKIDSILRNGLVIPVVIPRRNLGRITKSKIKDTSSQMSILGG
jgi:hypothetical protein